MPCNWWWWSAPFVPIVAGRTHHWQGLFESWCKGLVMISYLVVFVVLLFQLCTASKLLPIAFVNGYPINWCKSRKINEIVSVSWVICGSKFLVKLRRSHGRGCDVQLYHVRTVSGGRCQSASVPMLARRRVLCLGYSWHFDVACFQKNECEKTWEGYVSNFFGSDPKRTMVEKIVDWRCFNGLYRLYIPNLDLARSKNICESHRMCRHWITALCCMMVPNFFGSGRAACKCGKEKHGN